MVSKLLNFLKRGKHYYIVSLMVLAIMTVLYACMGVFPFGNKTICCYDDYCQFAPFITLVRDNLWELTDPFFTYLGGGSTTLPQAMFYCILSPFNIFYLIIPSVNVYYLYNIVQVLKMIAMANVVLWFTNQRFNDVKLEYKIFVAVLYAFSSYVIVQNCYTAWLDFMIYMPILWHNFLKMIDTRKIGAMSICIALMIINCYVLGVFALIVMSFILLMYIFLVVPKESRGVVALDLVLSYIIGIVCSLGVLYIAFRGLTSTDRLETSTLSNLINCSIDNAVGRFAFMLFDFIALFGAVIYIIKCDKTLSHNKFLIAVTVFNILFNAVDVIYIIFSGLGYNGFQYRLSFVTVFFIFLVFIYYLQDLSSRENSQYTFKAPSWQYVALLLSVVVCGGNIYVVLGFCKEIAEFLTNSTADINMFICVLLIVGMLWLGIIISKHLLNIKNIDFKCFKISIVMFAVCNIFTSSILCMFGQLNCCPATPVDVYLDFKDKFNVPDSDKIINMSLQQNIMYKATNLNQFNSLINVPEFVPLLDYQHSQVYVDRDNNLFVDSIMGYKYYFNDAPLDEEYLELRYKANGFYIYENKLAISGGLVLNDYNFNIVSENGVDNVNALYRYLGGEGDIYTSYTILDIIEGKCNDMVVTTEYDINSDTLITPDCHIGIEFLPKTNMLVYSDNGKHVSVINKSYMDTHHDYASVCDANEKINIDMYSFSYGINLENKKEIPRLMLLDYDKVYNLLSSINMPEVEVEYNGRVMNVKTTALTTTQSLILTLPKLSNYTATINGNKVDINTTIGDLMKFDLSLGENEIVITYHDDTGLIFIMVTLIGIVLGIVLCMLRNKLQVHIDKCGKVMAIATGVYVVLFIAIIDVSVVLDLCCNILRLIGLNL